LSSLNSLPSELYSYDTAEPWSTFVGTTALGFFWPVVLALILVALLHGLDALRRRLGIPMLPAGPWRSARNDVLIMGLGLGGLFYAATGLDALFPQGDMRSPPVTDLNDLVPVLAGVPDIPANAIGVVSILGIPILVVAGLTPRRSWRALITVTLLALVAAITWSFDPAGDVDAAGLVLMIASFMVAAVGIRVWGGRSAWAWIVAALVYQALDALPDAVYGPEWQTRVAGTLIVIGATALIALTVRRARPSPAVPP
jgi:hypothetical protein